MRKIVSGFAASLDGYIEGPNGEYDWILVDKEINFAEQMKRFDTMLLGRKTYEKMNGMFSDRMKHYVFSATLTGVHKNCILIRDNVAETVQQLKSRPGKDIAVFGGANLLASLLHTGLVDEISVAVIPVLLGRGKPMVDVLTHNVWLTLTGTKTYANGTVQLTYDVLKTENKKGTAKRGTKAAAKQKT